MTAAADRLPLLQAAMRERGVDLCVVGLSEELRWLLGYGGVPDERLTALLVTREDAVMVLPDFVAPEFAAVAGRPPVATWSDRAGPAEGVAAALDRLADAAAGGTVLVDGALPFRHLAQLRERIATPAPADELFAALRLRKGAPELELIARAGELVSDGVDFALATAAPGMTELQLKRAIETRLSELGAESLDYVLVQAGANSSAAHHDADATVLRAGEPVLVDVAVRRDGWFADITAQVFLGEPPQEYLDHYAVVRRAQEAGVQAARVGASAHDVAAAASQVIVDAGLGAWNGPRTGHGIGVGAHEAPSVVEGNAAELVEGAVITVEPGVYVPGRWGIRIEDTVALTAAGPRRLTRGARDLTVRSLRP